MSHKFIKYFLFTLLVLVLGNAAFFVFGENIPDNIYQISDSTPEISSISYFFSSILSFLSFYSGVWLVLPLLFLALSYILVIHRRNKNIDNVIPLSLMLFSLSFSLLLLPEFVGEGLLQVGYEFLTTHELILSTTIFALASLFLILRGSLSSTVTLIRDFFIACGRGIWNFINSSILKIKRVFNGTWFSELIDTLTAKFAYSLRKVGLDKKRSSKKQEAPVDSYRTYSEVEAIAPTDTESVIASNPTVEISEQVIDTTPAKVAKPRVRKVTVQNKPFIESSALIECITSEDQKINIDSPDEDYFKMIITSVEEKLAEFNIEAKVVNILKGPVVDTFELEIGAGIKVSRIVNLSDDLGLALGSYIRIVIQMKGKSTIGVEVPRNPREIIYLDDVLRSKSYINSSHRLPIAMGKNAFGEASVLDLAGMPHMLVAGATGAGKSVFINTMLVSLIVKKSPREMKLILIDPKQLELALYQDLPHLMLPVVTEAKMASIALLWAVQEMERRYSILMEMGVKNIEGFNKKIKTAGPEMLGKLHQHYEAADDEGYELPYLVIVIDEFADLILTKVGKEIETNVSRLAAKARAAGIHLVLATQRPSTDVITGVIKSNFPTRVSFRVTSNTDSRVVLDTPGAEKLLGKGDMLYKHGIDLFRLHSAFVEEEEIDNLVARLSTEISSEYNSSAMEFIENGGEMDDEDSMNGPVTVSYGGGKDKLYDEAVKVVMEQGSASASMLQRRLRVGYNRAANLVEEMERNGIVGPQQGSKPRKVLVSSGE